MKKVICILLVLILTLTCVSCSKEPAKVWGDSVSDVLSGASENPLHIAPDFTLAFGADNASGSITVNGAIFTENCIAFDIESENYAISDVLVLAGDLHSELSGYNSFEDIKAEYKSVGIGSTRRLTVDEDNNASKCTMLCFNSISLKDNDSYTLVFSGSEFPYPVFYVIPAENYNQMKTVDVKDEHGDVIGIATISALYAEINMYPIKLNDDSFVDQIFVSAGRKNIIPFEATVHSIDGYSISLNFNKILDIDAVDYILYKG